MDTHDSIPVRGPMEPLEARADEGQVAPPYREPQLFALGTAVEVLRSTPSGNARDSQNWHVYP